MDIFVFMLSDFELRILQILEISSVMESLLCICGRVLYQGRSKMQYSKSHAHFAAVQQRRLHKCRYIACPEVRVASVHALHFSSQRAVSLDNACLKIEHRIWHVSIFKKPFIKYACPKSGTFNDAQFCTIISKFPPNLVIHGIFNQKI